MTRLLPALGFALTLALPAFGQGLEDMTDTERQAFRDEVRAYLLDNPEVLMEAIAVLEERQAAEGAARDMQLVARYQDELFNSPFDLIEGNPDGDITIVEFMDYRCSYCRRAAPEVAELLAADGNIRLVVKELPILGEPSTMASRFALSARYALDEAAYASLHAALMSMRADVTEASLVRLADTLGYDGMEILAGMDDPQIDEVLEANYLLAQSMQISGTPTFVMGRQLIRGFMPADAMVELIAEERAAMQ